MAPFWIELDNAGDGDNLSYKTSSQIIPTYQHLTFYRPDALPATQPTHTEKHLGLGDFLYPRTLSFTQSLDFCQSSLVFLATVAVGFFLQAGCPSGPAFRGYTGTNGKGKSTGCNPL